MSLDVNCDVVPGMRTTDEIMPCWTSKKFPSGSFPGFDNNMKPTKHSIILWSTMTKMVMEIKNLDHGWQVARTSKQRPEMEWRKTPTSEIL